MHPPPTEDGVLPAVIDYEQISLWATFAANNPGWKIAAYIGSEVMMASLTGYGDSQFEHIKKYAKIDGFQGMAFSSNRIVTQTFYPNTTTNNPTMVYTYANGSFITVRQFPDVDQSNASVDYRYDAIIGAGVALTAQNLKWWHDHEKLRGRYNSQPKITLIV